MNRGESRQSSGSTIEYKYKCPICLEPFSRQQRPPISLNCGHTFCSLCVARLPMTTAGPLGGAGSGNIRYKMSCGVCRAVTFAPHHVMKKNVLVMELLDEQGQLASDNDPSEHISLFRPVSQSREQNSLHQPNDNAASASDPALNWSLLVEHNHELEQISENIRTIRDLRGSTNFDLMRFQRDLDKYRVEFDRIEREWERLNNLSRQVQSSMHDAAQLISDRRTAGASAALNSTIPVSTTSRQQQIHNEFFATTSRQPRQIIVGRRLAFQPDEEFFDGSFLSGLGMLTGNNWQTISFGSDEDTGSESVLYGGDQRGTTAVSNSAAINTVSQQPQQVNDSILFGVRPVDLYNNVEAGEDWDSSIDGEGGFSTPNQLINEIPNEILHFDLMNFGDIDVSVRAPSASASVTEGILVDYSVPSGLVESSVYEQQQEEDDDPQENHQGLCILNSFDGLAGNVEELLQMFDPLRQREI